MMTLASLELIGLAITLPSQSPSARTKAWRALKSVGAAVLRDGVYVLPASIAREEALRQVGQDVEAAGGTAELLLLKARDEEQEARFRSLFDRSTDYGEIIAQANALARDAVLELPQVERQLRTLQRQFDQVSMIDFFPGEAQAQAARALAACEHQLAQKLSPGEPHSRQSPILRLNPQDYQGRIWATRARPWVDRLASAWLIQRQIDPQASFVWLKEPSACPLEALGFDFDGARFSHVGGRVTYETLLESFGLEEDAALRRLGAIVHYLDVGGVPVPEALGVAAVLAGARAKFANDDDLLRAATTTFDWLYEGFRDLS